VRLGILGGTFDPVHAGHLAAAHAALDCARLDRVVFMPSAQPPHRPPAVADASERLAMCRLAVEGEPRFEVSDLEIRRGGASFTSDTLAELKRTRPGDELFLILGWDAARLFDTWHEPGKVRQLASVVVVSRPGAESPDAAHVEAAGLDPSRLVLCLRATPDISASRLRQAVAAGGSIAGSVPAAVERYIADHDLYPQPGGPAQHADPTSPPSGEADNR
jgi:nicotinate-nucleotide adenylyltransferase